jgi:hypothetical protein
MFNIWSCESSVQNVTHFTGLNAAVVGMQIHAVCKVGTYQLPPIKCIPACDISGSHGGSYEDGCLLVGYAMWSGNHRRDGGSKLLQNVRRLYRTTRCKLQDLVSGIKTVGTCCCLWRKCAFSPPCTATPWVFHRLRNPALFSNVCRWMRHADIMWLAVQSKANLW